MGRLIALDAVLACFHEWVDQYGNVHTPDEIPEYRRIEELPTVELVRCRECRRLHVDCPLKASALDYPSGNDFCSRGKRKDGK